MAELSPPLLAYALGRESWDRRKVDDKLDEAAPRLKHRVLYRLWVSWQDFAAQNGKSSAS